MNGPLLGGVAALERVCHSSHGGEHQLGAVEDPANPLRREGPPRLTFSNAFTRHFLPLFSSAPRFNSTVGYLTQHKHTHTHTHTRTHAHTHTHIHAQSGDTPDAFPLRLGDEFHGAQQWRQGVHHHRVHLGLGRARSVRLTRVGWAGRHAGGRDGVRRGDVTRDHRGANGRGQGDEEGMMRAARGGVGWSKLSRKAGVGLRSAARFLF